MSKFTPGPWISVKKVSLEKQTEWCFVVNSSMFSKQHIQIAEGLTEANARLTAAAPDLLRAAQASKELLVTLYPIFESIDKASTNTDYANGMKVIIGTLKLVIEKAGSQE